MNIKKRWNTIAWILWAIAGGVLEGIALKQKKKGDTLSEHVFYLFKTPVLWWTGAALLGWVTFHFLSRGKADTLLEKIIGKKDD